MYFKRIFYWGYMEKTNILESALEVTGTLTPAFEEILTPGALAFVEKLESEFGERRKDLLNKRVHRQKEIDGGMFPHFLSETEHIRNSDWSINPVKNDLHDRRVEITGPVDRKMIINALNSNVKVFMADFEDSTAPTWNNLLNGQINLRDANQQTISFENLISGKQYSLNEETATLMVRPRGWHLEEKNITLKGQFISASIFDFGLYFYHNAQTLIQNDTGPYFYLPKLESHLEARLWNDIFIMSQDELDIPQGSIKATVLIETILAAFEMDEILYELREHSAGLNCGRWDYIFSFIKKFRNHADFVLPNRSEITMERHFLKSYVDLLIQTCHKRGAHAMGGMAAQIPIKNDAIKNQKALDKVQADKEREVNAGHDGTWVAHPGLAQIALNAFDSVMPKANQLDVKRTDVTVTAEDLLKVPTGVITEAGVRENIRVGVQYVESWLRGNGCVPLYNLMEDAATAEIGRAQLWQWIKHSSILDDGRTISMELYNSLLKDEMNNLQAQLGDELFQSGKFELAINLFTDMVQKDEFDEFLTLPAYQYI
jgi:malate synthase